MLSPAPLYISSGNAAYSAGFPLIITGRWLTVADQPFSAFRTTLLTTRSPLESVMTILAGGLVTAWPAYLRRRMLHVREAELERCGWELTVMTRNLHADAALCEGNIMTEYEEKFSAAGHPICCLKAHPGAVNRSSTC